MELIQEFFQLYIVETLLVIAVLLVIIFIMNVIMLIKTNRTRDSYTKLVNGREGINLEFLLSETGEEINILKNKMIAVQEKTEELNKKMPYAVQKVGFIRYNAFADMGSDLSFSFALLDDLGNGFVFTSIYGRNHAFNYAKPLKHGDSTYPLSVEEMQAIDRAKKSQLPEKEI